MDGESARLLAEYVDGNSDAATEIFHEYVARLIALARAQLSPQLQARFDAEDIVQSACRSFFRKAKSGEFHLQRSGDLWRILAAFTLNKARSRVEKELAQKRDPRQEVGASWIDDVIQDEPSPEELQIVVEQLTLFMEELVPRDRRILELRLQGESIDTIAEELSRTDPEATVIVQTVSHATIRRVLRNLKESLRQTLFEDERFSGFSEHC